MNNLELIVKVMQMVNDKEQRKVVEFKKTCVVDGKEVARNLLIMSLNNLSFTEQMRVWYAFGREQLSLPVVKSLEEKSRTALIMILIFDDSFGITSSKEEIFEESSSEEEIDEDDFEVQTYLLDEEREREELRQYQQDLDELDDID